MTTKRSEAAREERPPLTDDHKAKVRAGIMASAFINTWLPEEEATARNLYERGVAAREIAETINALYKRGRTPGSISSHMHRKGIRFGSALQPDEIAADASIARKIRQGDKRARWCENDEEERAVWHPLRDNKKLLEILSR